MSLKSCLLPAVLASTLVAFGQQPASPAPPPAGSPPPPAGTTAVPSSDQAAKPPDAPAPPPSQNAGQNPAAYESQGSTSATEPQESEAEPAQNSGRALTTSEAQSQIEKKLRGEPGLSSRNIKVEVTDNAVVLSGTVPTSNQSLLAQRIAQSYAGTRRVTNNLNVETGAPGATGSSGASGQPQQSSPPPDSPSQPPQ
jgi:BON domain